jgi:HEAT repeat protein
MNEPDALSVLASSDADTYKKAMACDALGRTGTAKAVPVLAGLLADEQLHDYARDGLERIPDPSAGEALRAALESLKGNLLVGVVITLGDRRDGTAVPELAKLAGGDDPALAGAALASLAQIATGDAAAAILEVHESSSNAGTKLSAAHAALAAAGRMAEGGQKETAAKLRTAAAASLPADH